MMIYKYLQHVITYVMNICVLFFAINISPYPSSNLNLPLNVTVQAKLDQKIEMQLPAEEEQPVCKAETGRWPDRSCLNHRLYINIYVSLSLSQSFQFFHCLRNCYYMLDHFVHHIQSSSTKICFGCAAHENCPRRPPGTAQENRPMIERLPLVLWQCVRA